MPLSEYNSIYTTPNITTLKKKQIHISCRIM